MNNLTPADLDKLDALQSTFTRAIVGDTFSPNLEIFLRIEFNKFIGDAIERYERIDFQTSCSNQVIYN